MKKPQTPPMVEWQPTLEGSIEDKDGYFGSAMEFNLKYLHWDEVRRRDVKGMDPEKIWSIMSVLRRGNLTSFMIDRIPVRYTIIESFQRSIHEIDRRSSGEFIYSGVPDPKVAKSYAVSSLMEESIASGQIEGAVTTTRIAKTMLRDGRRPANASERMIFNNYKTMQFIKEKKDEDLTPRLILEIHKIITEDSLEDKAYEGRYRDTDDIVVQDISGEVFHEPPKFSDISKMLDSLCEYVNSDRSFVHPLIKSIVLHFMIAYIHPFIDGNGRLARSLMYWYLLKKGYRIFEYLAISKIIKEHRGKYDMAYLFSETDGNDITYFIRYNLDCMEKALETFIGYIDRKNKEYNETGRQVHYGLDLNMRQRSILRDAMKGELLSIYGIRSSYQVSYQTAANDVHKLESLGLLREQGKDGNRRLYSLQHDENEGQEGRDSGMPEDRTFATDPLSNEYKEK